MFIEISLNVECLHRWLIALLPLLRGTSPLFPQLTFIWFETCSLSTNPDLTAQGLPYVAETYANSAKVPINSSGCIAYLANCSPQTAVNAVSHIPSVDTLHALMLLAWYEYKANRMSGKSAFSEDTCAFNDVLAAFRDYAQLSSRMASQLGYSSGNVHGHEGDWKKHTMKALYHLQLIASQY